MSLSIWEESQSEQLGEENLTNKNLKFNKDLSKNKTRIIALIPFVARSWMWFRHNDF